jgi:hypothetical protein
MRVSDANKYVWPSINWYGLLQCSSNYFINNFAFIDFPKPNSQTSAFGADKVCPNPKQFDFLGLLLIGNNRAFYCSAGFLCVTTEPPG